jgi:hypothetical protein
MLSTHDDEILGFIREFEISSREYLQSKGLSEYEMTNAYLDFQWNFLHTILQQRSDIQRRALKPHIFCSGYAERGIINIPCKNSVN